VIRKGPKRGQDGADEAVGTEESVVAAEPDGEAPASETGGPGDDPVTGEEAGALQELPEAEVLLEELAQARREIETLNDRHLRLAAEYDNFRKRTAREREDLRTFAQIEIARSVVPTLDDLARWRDIPNESTTVEALDKGLDLILKNLEKALADHGVERVAAEGAPFDPEVHQALMTGEAERPEQDDTVGKVFSNGFTIRGQLVRPAQVEVLRWQGPAPDAADETPREENGGAGPEDVEP
jgi:molecular chaperone GrpE